MYEEDVNIFTSLCADDALDIVKDTKIDLIFTDIRMPNTDGLELAKTITRISPSSEIVILSAYDQKEYLKKAINLNVFRYLLKPVNPTDIIEVTRLVSEKRRRLNDMSANETMELLQSKITKFLVSNDYDPQKIKEISDKAFESPFFYCKYYAVCLIFRENNNFDLEILKAIRNIEQEDKLFSMKSKKNNSILYIFGSNDESLSNTLANRFKVLLPEDIKIKIQICIGNSVCKPEKISESYINTCVLAEQAFYEGKGIYIYENINFNSNELPDAAIFNTEIIPCYEDGFNSFLNDTYNSLKKSASVPRKTVHILFFNIINHMYIQAKNSGAEPDISIDDLFYLDFLTLDDLYDFSYNFIATHSLYLNINKVAFNIKNYIKQNYRNKDLSIDMIASQFYLSPQYIPKLFKKTFNISIKQYISDTRISAAKVLIRTQDMGVKNIAEAVGYEDANYFSRLFKKKTGMTFTEYRIKFKD